MLSTKFITPNSSCWLSKKARRHYQVACTISFKIKAIETTRSSTAKNDLLAFSKRYSVSVWTGRNESKNALSGRNIFFKMRKRLRFQNENVFVWTGRNDSKTERPVWTRFFQKWKRVAFSRVDWVLVNILKTAENIQLFKNEYRFRWLCIHTLCTRTQENIVWCWKLFDCPSFWCGCAPIHQYNLCEVVIQVLSRRN